jgi:hypothetical protein
MKNSIWILMLLGAITLVSMVGCAPQASAPLTVLPTNDNSSKVLVKSNGKLSSRLEMLVQSSTLRTASVKDQAQALSLPAEGAGSLARDEAGRILVNIRMTDTSETQQQALRNAGAVIQNISDQYETVSAFVAVSDLSVVADLQTVQSVEEELTPGTDQGSAGGVMNPSQP